MLQGFLYYLWLPFVLSAACWRRPVRAGGWVLLIAVALLACALVVLVFEWYIYNRRVYL